MLQQQQKVTSPDGRYIARLATFNGMATGWEYVTLQPWSWFPSDGDEVAENGDEWGIEHIAWKGPKTLVVTLEPDFDGNTTDVLKPKWRDIQVVVTKQQRK
jgi:hypothetical protein